jgi:telomerase reverse transcriptase
VLTDLFLDVLNRFPYQPMPSGPNDPHIEDPSTDRSTVQVMMYIFPRQFGLHNPFTTDVDPRQTVQPFQDYTLREEEINRLFPGDKVPKIPKRLRGLATSLVKKLQIQHSRCPYKELLDYYCPVRLITALR